jgi:hypothetical protein
MNAASPLDSSSLPIPLELARLFQTSETAESTYGRMRERDRRGFITYIELGRTPSARERRAAVVATSLIGLSTVVPS